MRVLKEEVIGTRGGWVVKARIVLYHNKIRRAELYLEKMEHGFQEVGWTVEELAELHNQLVLWKEKNKEQ